MKFSMVALDLTTSLKIVLKFQNCQCMHCLAFIFSATLYVVFYSHPFEIFVGFFGTIVILDIYILSAVCLHIVYNETKKIVIKFQNYVVYALHILHNSIHILLRYFLIFSGKFLSLDILHFVSCLLTNSVKMISRKK